MDFYDLLGVTAAASASEIKSAFRVRAKLFHPDINSSSDADENFRTLYIAYATLIDPMKRKLYDQLLIEDLNIESEWVSRAQYEKMQRRAAMRARMYANMQYDQFESRTFSKAGFHAKQVAAFIIFFGMMCGGMILLTEGTHYVFKETYNGAQVTGYAFWLGGLISCYISSKALLAIYETWRLGGSKDL